MNYSINMKKYLIKINRGFLDGFFSIGKSMSSMRLYPNKIKILSDTEAYEEDAKSIRSDWEIVGNDLRKSIHKLSLENKIL